MKKIIITTAVIFSASLSFYLHEGISISRSIDVLSQSATYDSILGLGLTTGHKLDISQADIK